jgi:hypothetical protein
MKSEKLLKKKAEKKKERKEATYHAGAHMRGGMWVGVSCNVGK